MESIQQLQNIKMHLLLYGMLSLIFYFNIALPLKWIDLNLTPKSSANFLLVMSVNGTHQREGILKKKLPEELNYLQLTGSASTATSLCDLEMILTGELPNGDSTGLRLYHLSFSPIPVRLVTGYSSHIWTQLMLKLSILPTQIQSPL